ncbi:MAG: hypothetical protein Q4A28_03895 [Brachymonas sp.]|nr:hypothetical protein [Brachymonas sp.]
MAMTGNQATVMRAFATLTATAPSRADYQYVLDHFNTHGKEASIQVLNNLFASYTDEQLATMLLNTTYLNTIDLEGDGNTDNMGIATGFIRANAGNRIGAILDLTELLSQFTSGPFASIANAYNAKINAGYLHATHPGSSTAVALNFPQKINGSAGHETFYVDNTGFQQSTIGGKTSFTRAAWVFNTAGQGVWEGDSSQKLGNLQPDTVFDFAPSWKTTLQIHYRGLTSQKIALNDLDYKVTKQELNQGIKHAIRGDAVLSQLLEVEDGPGGILKVFAKTDGEHGRNALHIQGRGQWDGTNDAILNSLPIDTFFDSLNDSTSPRTLEQVKYKLSLGYLSMAIMTLPQVGRSDDDTLVTGKNAANKISHVIEGAGGNDLIVLSSTNAAADDVVQFNSAFGHDTIVNFTPNGSNHDKLDFGLLHRTAYDTTTRLHNTEIANSTATVVGRVTNGQIRLVQKNTQPGITAETTDNDSSEDVKQLFIDEQTGIASKQLYIAIDHDTSTADVYQVTDGGSANDLNVTLLGNITLANHADTHVPFSWLTLNAANFA